jgi:hypothetical protein
VTRLFLPRAPTLAIVAATVTFTAVACAQLPLCTIAPSRRSFPLPAADVLPLPSEDVTTACPALADSGWTRQPGDSTDLLVHTDGPHGSGRYWTIAVAALPAGDSARARGFCVTTSTVGWRTLQRFPTALPWAADRDADGRPELVLWESFALRPEPIGPDYGLVAWVFELQGDSALVLDVAASRTLAGEIAAAYRAPLDGPPWLGALRVAAARRLIVVAERGCELRPGEVRAP